MAKEASYTAWTSSKYGTSPLVALLIFANYEITGFLVSGESSSVNGVDVHLLDLFWTSAMVLALLASNFVLRKRPVRTFPMNLTAWALSSVFAATTNGLAASAISGKPLPTSYQLELLGGVVSMFASCLLFTLIVSGFTEGRSLQKKLRSAQSELLATRSTFVARLDDYAKQLSEPVQKLVSQLTARAEPLLKTHVRAAEVTKLISAVLDRDLREVLQDLDSKRGEPSRAGSGKTKLDSSLKPLRRLPWAHSLNLPGTYAMLVLFFGPASFVIADASGLTAFALSLVTALFVELMLKRFVADLRGDWILFAGAHALISAATQLPFGFALGGENYPALAFAVSMSLIVFASSGLQSAIVRRDSLNRELDRLNAGLKSSISELEQRMRQLRNRAASDLHNRVQAELLRLGISLTSLEYLDEGAIAGVKKTLMGLLSDEDRTTPAAREPLEYLAELTDFWEGALETEVHLPESAQELLRQDTLLLERVLAVLREALTNAAKYSNDGRVAISVEASEPKALKLEVVNGYDSRLEKLSRGMGSAILDENATTWSRSVAGNTFVLSAAFETY